MTHKVLLRFPTSGTIPHVNINESIGLGPFSDYSLEEYIEDRRTEGVTVIERLGGQVVFSDGESGRYEQSDQPVPCEVVPAIVWMQQSMEELRQAELRRMVEGRAESTFVRIPMFIQFAVKI